MELSADQMKLLEKFKHWVETEADFYGRSEKDFLILFLHSCGFNLEMSKKTLRSYYLTRIKYPEWWTNRDLNHPQIQFLIKERLAFALMDQNADSNCPTVIVIHVSRLGPDPAIVDSAGIYLSCGLDAIAKRINCQLNGAIIVFDYSNCYWWILGKAFWLPFLKNVFNAFLLSVPINVKTVVLVNAPAITSIVVNIVRSFIPEAYKNKFQCCRNWSEIGQFIPVKMLPVEWGGYAGTIKSHEDAAINELLALNDYFLDDNKYGFRSN